ncbi:MAG: D-alanine-D-alanine ligase, partial [Planctomycetota bacterium]
MTTADLTTLPSWTRLSRPEVRQALAKTSVVVLHGGASDEREVSSRSGESVLEALTALIDDNRENPPLRNLTGVEIDTAGRWRVGHQSMAAEDALRELPSGALFFLALHGGEGEDGTIQDFLGTHGRLYTGSGVLSSALCMDKGRTRAVLRKAGLATPPGRLVRRADWASQRRRVLMELAALGGVTGWFVKPNRGGSSLGVTHVVRADE